MLIIYLFVGLIITLINLPLIFNPQFFHQFTYGDLKIAAFIAHLISKGARLYDDFAIVYGPGRFILLAGLNRLFSVDISIPLTISYQQLVNLVIVPFGLYLVTFTLLDIGNSRLRVILSILPPLVYYCFFRSGQDTHVVILLLIASVNWWAKTHRRLAAAVTGLMVAGVGLFRFEALISTLIALAVLIAFNHNQYKNKRYFTAAFTLSLLCYLAFIAVNGSLTNFFHDVILMGIISQPRLMKITIAPVDYPLFEFFFLLTLASILTALSQKTIRLHPPCISKLYRVCQCPWPSGLGAFILRRGTYHPSGISFNLLDCFFSKKIFSVKV